ncbi:hypothetical protein F2Q70_00025750 [Brassica cretica]|uniref:Uncharacterized protein n=1 Tax=Brassica cretica TaxID=69181 RepID=A0A8S9L6W0_BRACR|nr:hypothetical protein F2Q70_00025750 [Brassica cretica]
MSPIESGNSLIPLSFNDLLENVSLPLQFLKPAFPASVTQPSSLSVLVVVVRAYPLTSSLMGFSELQERQLFDNFQVIANTNLELPDVVGQIHSVQGSDLSKYTTRVVIRLLTDPKYLSASPVPQTGVPGIRHSTFESLSVGRSSQSIASNLLAYGIP